ncbi:MAG TPA: MotA/TolQ/ExbB proton channel family protein [Candidatus Thiothrix moscowensis]|uniref:MotA/TolQ/ExbB proton channel family protein n=1 Tax=unclassified Thiothrix TaxID=2636184 RepID=UPI0025D76043|nr:MULTISPECIES: MotA/TolQ/ExbB proton channel family protein [unclassified Thiothrix]HRJ52073.1 MotA/TolQ/ExbB proton channel family protein [Candidatus Thiothrix moscowensis]HRJ92416.1 MotA/TolQ/ExbB proton channel family protein [Candidatus Thiothrix moscowensis]
MSRDSYMPFYGWLLWFGLMLFGGFLLWQYGLWTELWVKDQTYLSAIIVWLLVLVSVYLGRCSWQLSRQAAAADSLSAGLLTLTPQQWEGGRWLETHPASWAQEHLMLVLRQMQIQGKSAPTDSLQARLIERVHSGHSSGWFLSDLMLRLGLVGTVIGFVLMLGSVYELQAEGINVLKQLLTSMGGGMQVALYTTLAGLGSAMLVSIQCHWLDRCADRLISRIIAMSAAELPA